ncbi:MAG: hypothetical protein M3Z21_05695, partial [Pseudomonadota bacterium]|nr:hypothetical protein [Pseudomonadota bacterium]
MCKGLLNSLLLILCILVGAAAAAEAPAEPPALSAADVETLVRDLEDPQARERLIQQLRTLVQAKAAAEPESEVQDATLELLQAVSERAKGLTQDILLIVDDLNEIPRMLDW